MYYILTKTLIMIMKRITLIAFLLSFYLCVNAQKGFYVGGIAGIGQSSFNSSSLQNQSNKLFIGGGVRGIYHFNNYFGLEANGILTSKGTKASGTVPGSIFTQPEDFEEQYDLLYAEIPLLAKVRYGFGNFYIKAFIGPSFNFNLGGAYSIDFKNSTNKDVSNAKISGLKTMETALVYGAGIEVNDEGTGLYSLSVRLSNGLTDIGQSNRNNNNITTQYFAICLGWTTN